MADFSKLFSDIVFTFSAPVVWVAVMFAAYRIIRRLLSEM